MRALLAVLRKDLLVEWRARAHTVALIAFALNLLLVFSFAVGPDGETLRQHAGAYLWVGVLLASTLLLQRSFLVETESGALETVLLAPAPLAALFYGKALANTAQLMVLCAAALPAVVLLLGLLGLPVRRGGAPGSPGARTSVRSVSPDPDGSPVAGP